MVLKNTSIKAAKTGVENIS